MDINEEWKKLKEALKDFEPEEKPEHYVYVNQWTYEKVVEQLGFTPVNLFVNHYMPGDRAVVVNRASVEELEKKSFDFFNNGRRVD